MSIRPCFKHGIGKLTAAAEGATKLVGDVPRRPPTFLTQVSHKAPMRFVPLRQSSIAQAGAAVCAMSNYGGGMVQGDSLDLTVHAQTNARLGVTTQGASRIYTPNHRGPPTRSTLQATIDPDALLVWAPDPCSLFRSSSFQQRQTIRLHPTSSLALIDWFSSGRYRNGEQWAFDSLSAQTSLRMMVPSSHDNDTDSDSDTNDSPQEIPFLNDAVHLHLSSDVPNAQQSLGVSEFQTFASLILYGDQVEQVAQQCRFLSDALLSQHTRIRITNNTSFASASFSDNNDDDSDAFLDAAPSGKDLVASLGLSGRVCMGVSEVSLPSSITASNNTSCSSLHVVRLAAMTNEDLYRVFHHCLLPLQDNFGMQFYKERIRAQASEIPPLHAPTTPPENKKPASPISTSTDPILKESAAADAPAGSSGPSWAAYMLADSALPTGSFAHSAGLEVAAQTGWISPQSSESLESYIYAATRSTLQQTIPLIMSGHALSQTITTQTSEQEESSSGSMEWAHQWKELQDQAQSVLASNAPACAASVDQGKSLARVAQQWLREDVMSTLETTSSASTAPATNLPLLLKCFQETPCHIGVIWGGLSAALGLSASDAVHLYGYCVARDMVSAAVRLSLVGPLASVGTLHRVQQAGKDGWDAYVQRMESLDDEEQKDALSNPCWIAATSAPVLEAIHPCHDSLQVRLFRS